MPKTKKNPKKSVNLDWLIMLSHLGLFSVLASWFLCYTEFDQVCSDIMVMVMKMVLMGTLINISMLLFVKSAIKLQISQFALALLYTSATVFVYQKVVS